MVLPDAATPGRLTDLPARVGMTVDKHRGYALQWYAMAALTAGLWGYFAIFRRREDASDPS